MMKVLPLALLSLLTVDGFTVPSKLQTRKIPPLKVFRRDNDDENSRNSQRFPSERDSEKNEGPNPALGAVGGLGVGALLGFGLDTQLPLQSLLGSDVVAPAVLGTLLAGGTFAVLTNNQAKKRVVEERRGGQRRRNQGRNDYTDSSESRGFVAGPQGLSTQQDQGGRSVNGQPPMTNGDYRRDQSGQFQDRSLSNNSSSKPNGLENPAARVMAEIQRKTDELKAITAKRKTLEDQMDQATKLQDEKMKASRRADTDRNSNAFSSFGSNRDNSEELERRDFDEARIQAEIERRSKELETLVSKRKVLQDQLDQAKQLEDRKVNALRNIESGRTGQQQASRPTERPRQMAPDRRTERPGQMTPDRRSDMTPRSSLQQAQSAVQKATDRTSSRTAQNPIDSRSQRMAERMPQRTPDRPPERPSERTRQRRIKSEQRAKRREEIEDRLKTLEKLLAKVDQAEEEARQAQAQQLKQAAIESARAAAEAKRRAEEQERARQEEAARALRRSQEEAARERQAAAAAKERAEKRAEADRRSQQLAAVEERRRALEDRMRNFGRSQRQDTQQRNTVRKTKQGSSSQRPTIIPPQKSMAEMKSQQARELNDRFRYQEQQRAQSAEERRRSQEELKRQNAQEAQARQRAQEEQKARIARQNLMSQEELRAQSVRAADDRRRVLMEEKMRAEEMKRRNEEELRRRSEQAAEARRQAQEEQRRRAEEAEEARIEAQEEARLAQLEQLLEVAEARLFERLSRQPPEVLDRLAQGDRASRMIVDEILAGARRR